MASQDFEPCLAHRSLIDFQNCVFSDQPPWHWGELSSSVADPSRNVTVFEPVGLLRSVWCQAFQRGSAPTRAQTQDCTSRHRPGSSATIGRAPVRPGSGARRLWRPIFGERGEYP